MPTYTYTAVTKQGEHVSGKELAKDEHNLALLLRNKGYLLLEAEPMGAKKQGRQAFSLLSLLFRVSLGEKLMFMRSLKVMVSAGIALPKTLEILSLQAKSRALAKALEDMRQGVLQGKLLSDTMEQHASLFPELFRNMIRTGEEAGTLEQVLSQLTLQLEREHDLRSKVQGALVYPAVIVTAMFGIGIIMLVAVVPQLAKTFKELGIPLPATTRMIIGLADFLTHFWYIAIFLFGGIVLAFFQALRTKTGKRVVDTVLLKTPIARGIVKKVNTALFARTMSSLIAAGIPMVRSLEVTSTVLGNSYFRNVLMEGAEQMRKGIKLSEVLSRHTHLYPLVVVQMLEVGEETGQTSDLLAKLADFLEEEVTSVTKNLASVIEPLLMLLIGAVVGFFAVSMLQPMYAMLGSIQ